jgi:hypothetical protein
MIKDFLDRVIRFGSEHPYMALALFIIIVVAAS